MYLKTPVYSMYMQQDRSMLFASLHLGHILDLRAGLYQNDHEN